MWKQTRSQISSIIFYKEKLIRMENAQNIVKSSVRAGAMSPGFAFTMWSFLSLRFSGAVSVSPGRGGSWFLGCVCACSGGLFPDSGDLDPVDCSGLCQRKGFGVAAVTSWGCYCGNQELLSCSLSDCPNNSSTHVPGQRAVLLPVGEGNRNVALYQTSGPFLDRISLSVSPDRVFTNTTFTVHVSGNLAAPLDQSTGIFGLGRQDLSDVTVEFLGMTPKGQSSLHVNILNRGSFNVSSNWSLEAPGTYEIRVVATNILSSITAALNLTVLAQTPDALVKVWHGECDWALTQETLQSDIKSTKNKTVRIKEKREAAPNGNVEVHAAKRAYSTHTEIHFLAVTDAQGSMEFLWHFGDSTSARNMFNTITKKYSKPGRYNVTVVMVTPQMSTTSEPFPLIIQQAVKLNRLVHPASVLQNHSVVLSCRVNTGTQLNFLWTFGDGSSEHGQSTARHVFQNLGEFMVEVSVFNLVSSASLRSHMFVVDSHCQPPPVKNMGPLTLKLPRYEHIRLGVTYESEFDCDILVSGGVEYKWTLYTSEGQVFPLPHVETNRQTLVLPRHFLHYDTYTAVAKVKVVGSVVYSDYSVKLHVIETAPVAIIRGGTNIFINNKNTTVVTLDGTNSYDPDLPHNTVRFSWTCKPVSTISSSCFERDVPMFSGVITFPASFLKTNYDQFQFTLSVESAGRSGSSHVFLTVKTDLQVEVSVDCPRCHNDKVNWDQTFSVQAFSEQHKIPSNVIHFSWSLYQVNASSRPANEIPFCSTVDLSSPSSIKDTATETSPASAPRYPRHQRSVLDHGPDSTMDFAMTSSVEDGESFSLGEEPEPGSHREEGSNLVNVRPHVALQEPTLLDLPRDLVPRSIFESYTYTGISSSRLDLKPFSLRPGHRYMLEVTADSQKQLAGRTQLFFQTRPAPKGMTCQVQPTNGVELLTVFSIFCTTGKEYFLYEYSFSVGSKSSQTLYQGSDFEHYFNLPAGDPNDDYKGNAFIQMCLNFTISMEIRSSIGGGSTRPCPVTVRVQPQFVTDTFSSSDPVLNLSQTALRILSRRLGNSLEILNYIRIVTNILNRLSLEPEVNTQSQVLLRNTLVCILCDVKTIDQGSILDTVNILENLLQIQNQVTLATISQVISLMHFITNQLRVDQMTLTSMIRLLSHNLKTVTTYDITITAAEMEPYFSNIAGNNAMSIRNVCLTHHTGSLNGLSLAKHLVDSILHIISLLTLKFVLLNKIEEFKVRASVVSVYATHRVQMTTVSSGFCVFYFPQTFVRHLDTCVISVVTELNQNPYIWAQYPGQWTGPVFELSLFRCSTRRKIPIQFLAEPFEIEVRPQEKQTVTPEYTLQPFKINYHSFNISHEHLQHAIQFHVQFTPTATRGFPVMLLFRMFAKPTPTEHHLRKIHTWERSQIHMTLPSSYLNAGGVGYLALLKADFERPHRWRDTKVSYRVRVERSQCLSWDTHRGTWTDRDCRTQTVDTSSNINCSCRQLHPVTLRQEQISTNLNTGDIGGFLNVCHNWTVVVVLVLGVAFYVLALVLSQNADVVPGERRVFYLCDNVPSEPCLYAVTLHTGLCSAAEMSAKVYVVLCGEDGFTQMKELQVPGCTLFRRNSQDTFIISAAESLGSLRGIHIWHDNCGQTPTWFLKRVEVFELNRAHQVKGRSWLCDCGCWLAVDRSDGRVERMLRVCNEKMGFGKMLCLKVWDYMADFHIWISVCSCPNPNSFTQRQRMGTCVLLWLGYACVNAFIISQTNNTMHLELDIKYLSMNVVTTGMLSVAFVLPLATLLSFMFRLSPVKMMRLSTQSTGVTKTESFNDAPSLSTTMFELYRSWGGLHHWVQESWRKKYQDTDLSSVSSWSLDDKILDEIQNNMAISKEDIVIINGGDETQDLIRNVKKQENASKIIKESWKEDRKMCQWLNYVAWTLWLLFCMSCLVSSAVFGVRFTHREAVLWIQSLFFSLLFCISFIHPLLVFTMALVVSMWHRKSTDISSFSTRHMHESIYKAIQNWTLSRTRTPTLLKLLEARQRQRFLRLVRPPTSTELRKSRCKRKRDGLIRQTVWDWFVFASMLLLMLCVTYESSSNDCYNLNRAVKKHFIRSIAEYNLKQLQTEHWIGKSTVVLKVHFALFSPAPNLFTSVTLSVKPSSFGVLRPSASVQSVQVLDTVSQSDYAVMACKLIFLILLFLRLYHHICSIGEKGLLRYSKISCNWLEVSVFAVATVYYIYGIYRTALVSNIAELLQRQNSKTHIDYSQLATWDQTLRSLRGTLLFLLTLRCATLINKTSLPTRSIRSLFWMLVINIVSSSVKHVRRRRNMFNAEDLVQCIKDKLFSIWTCSVPTDHNRERKTYHFEQFESVLDELLFKLDVLSDSDQTEANREDSPILPRQDSAKIDAQVNNTANRIYG
ncbi:polycystin-1-like protein 1 [Eucyclogobius newberryi]|uniref:polycystin-1-like protein 1 n=1 Tax=Eucyclogobius newberryi TaxID=166745 RepID=UPI003B5AF9EB